MAKLPKTIKKKNSRVSFIVESPFALSLGGNDGERAVAATKVCQTTVLIPGL